MQPDYLPFTLEQFLQLKKIVLDNQNILFISQVHNSALFAMYQFTHALKHEYSKNICICEYEPFANRFYLQSTLVSKFGTQDLMGFVVNSVSCVRVFSDIPPNHAHSILSLCVEPEPVIACITCNGRKFISQKLRENLVESARCLTENTFNWIVEVKDAVLDSSYDSGHRVMYADIYKI